MTTEAQGQFLAVITTMGSKCANFSTSLLEARGLPRYLVAKLLISDANFYGM